MTTTTQDIRITRILHAPRERVWKAWTEPEQIARWWGRRGWSTPLESVTLDVRPGGAFRLDLQHDDARERRPARRAEAGLRSAFDRLAELLDRHHDQGASP